MKLVYLPIVEFDDLSGPLTVRDAGGQLVKISNSRIDLVDRKLCVVVEWIKADSGVHHVRTSNGFNLVVTACQEWRHTPFGSEVIVELVNAV